MQMLAAAGMPMTGRYPAYEDERIFDHRFYPSFVGRAVKFLDPHNGYIPEGYSFRWIWLRRNESEQAKSQVKFYTWMSKKKLRPGSERVLAKSIADDDPKCMAVLERLGGEVLHLRFEDILSSPADAAERIAQHLHLDAEAAKKMLPVVVMRPPGCLSYMLEERLVRRLR